MDEGINTKPLQIKGIREGLLVTLGEGAWAEMRQALLAQIEQQSTFFQGAKLVLDVGPLVLHAAEMGSLRDALSDRGVQLWGVLSRSPVTELTAQVLGLATRLAAPRVERPHRPVSEAAPQAPDGTMLVHRTLRSGVKVEHDGHVVVIGDVNAGAEVIAGGSVIVWGRLRGLAQAGAKGDDGAVVCALELEPTTLRIAGVVAPPQKKKGKPQPATARLQAGEVVIEIWNPKGR